MSFMFVICEKTILKQKIVVTQSSSSALGTQYVLNMNLECDES